MFFSIFFKTGRFSFLFLFQNFQNFWRKIKFYIKCYQIKFSSKYYGIIFKIFQQFSVFQNFFFEIFPGCFHIL